MAFTKIQDVTVPTKGIGKYFLLKAIDLSLPGTTALFYWSVCTEITEHGTESDEQVIKIPGGAILDGNIQMTEAEYAQWGTDDQYAIDWGLQKLGFTKI